MHLKKTQNGTKKNPKTQTTTSTTKSPKTKKQNYLFLEIKEKPYHPYLNYDDILKIIFKILFF